MSFCRAKLRPLPQVTYSAGSSTSGGALACVPRVGVATTALWSASAATGAKAGTVMRAKLFPPNAAVRPPALSSRSIENLSPNDPAELLRKRDLTFLRTLLHHDYTKARCDVWAQQVAFWHAHPGATPADYYVDFDYTRGRTAVSVVPLSPDPRTQAHASTGPPGEPEPAARAAAAAAGGRLELHCMRVSEGGAARAYWIPLRASSARLVDGLRAIASRPDADFTTGGEREWLGDAVRRFDEELQAADGAETVILAH
ncbi:hypothetical protein GGX14DRAFT_606081 [Mycena pura]|uniref:Uncharacterized protein n=1 Tax=Mycena pura TaxID=153505 RepID=A0AAD6XZV9_9AGAR|nr:hypothetical protein GGX14DRAFT_606081 [Mycena pura]